MIEPKSLKDKLLQLNQQQYGHDVGLNFNSSWCILFVIALMTCYINVLFTLSLEISSLN